MSIKKIKESALKRLNGNYLKCIFALVIFMSLSCLFEGVAYLINNKNMSVFFEILLTGLLYMGLLQIYVKVARGKKTELKELFSRTDLFWKCMAITIILISFTLLCGLLGFIAYKSLEIFTVYQTDLSVPIVGFMIIVGVLLCTCIALFYIVIAISFSQVFYVLYDNNDMPVLDIFNKSFDLMENHRLEYILYKLSFIGWIIAGILTFGLIFLWAGPYMMVCDVNYYDYLVKDSKKKKKKTKK